MISVADAAGNVATISQSLVLDTTADQSPTTTLVVGTSQSGAIAVDGSLNVVSFSVAGLDADATGTVTFTDGTNVVTAGVTADGIYSVDLSSLTLGAITSSMAIGDAAGNSALVSGNTLYTTIQSAINAAHGGDTITVAAGTYNENLTVDKERTIVGANGGVAGTDGAGRGPGDRTELGQRECSYARHDGSESHSTA